MLGHFEHLSAWELVGLFAAGVAIRTVVKALLGDIGTLILLAVSFVAYTYKRRELQGSNEKIKEINERNLQLRSSVLRGPEPGGLQVLSSKSSSSSMAFSPLSSLFGAKKYGLKQQSSSKSDNMPSFSGNIRGGFSEPLFYNREKSGRIVGKVGSGDSRSSEGGGIGGATVPRKRVPYRGRRKRTRMGKGGNSKANVPSQTSGDNGNVSGK